MSSLQEAVEQLLATFSDEEGSGTGSMPVGEFVYRLVIAMVHAGMLEIAAFLEPMGTVVIEDRPDLSLFDTIAVELEDEEGAVDEGGEKDVDDEETDTARPGQN